MGEDGPVQVVVELERGGSTVSGKVAVAGAPAAGFFGGLELIDRFERAAQLDARDRDRLERASEPEVRSKT
jgi:hypothetical protein